MQNNPPSKIELLQSEAAELDLVLDNAIKSKLIRLLSDPETDPKVLLEFLKIYEKRQAHDLKLLEQEWKTHEQALQKEFADRKMALKEREQVYKVKKLLFGCGLWDMSADAREQVERFYSGSKMESPSVPTSAPSVVPTKGGEHRR